MKNLPFSKAFLLLASLFIMACQSDFHQEEDPLHSLPEKVSYNFHIRPILADRCFSCHGPDEAARKGGLRLDDAASAYASLESGGRAIHRAKPKRSKLLQRIYSENPELQMPPPESNLALSELEKALISKWIKQGAVYEKHWAFQKLHLPKVPSIKSDWAQNEIDYFILQKLNQEDLKPTSPASKERLLRRLSFDLRGLPATPEEVDQFVNDKRPEAYEEWVDRFINSDAYAERMTMDWMDLARYADSQGLHSDGWRSMYPWRDWVLKAFREHMPYDQFLSWQLAGDLMPNPNRDQLVATGFNRNHKTSAEGGIVDEEFRAEYVHDRVATTATTFLGLTMECARCHDHKYDPLSQKDYYQFYAFFNQIDDLGMSGDDGNAGPNLLLPSKSTEAQLQKIQSQIKEKAKLIEQEQKEILAQKDFIKKLQEAPRTGAEPKAFYLPFDQIEKAQLDGKIESRVVGDIALVEDEERGEVLEFKGEYTSLSLKEQGLFDQHQPFSASIWVKPEARRTSQTLFGNSEAKGTFWRGWDFILDSLNRPSLRLIHALPHDVLTVRSKTAIPIQNWSHVAFSYDGSAKATGVQIYIDGKAQALEVVYDKLQRSIYPMSFNKSRTDRPLRFGKSYRGFTGEYGIYLGLMDDFYLFERSLLPLEVKELAGLANLKDSLNIALQKEDAALLHEFARIWQSRKPSLTAQEISSLREAHFKLLDTVPEVMVMKERSSPRPTYILNRGNYDEPKDLVEPGTPASIFDFDPSFPTNRLGLVQWMLEPKHPLTSRVYVNRLWQQFFGKGLVNTPHDLGLQGSLPTHPELLDWLATTFIQKEWNIQAIQKMIVLSATYQQSSIASPALRSKDPNNNLWARGPSCRLPAEMVRDNALAASGLLYHKMGGPSVKPIQPEGLWQEKTSSTHILRKYEADKGRDQFRRSLYTFVRRTSPHPVMTAFDAPNRSVCTAQRQYTNTPMQALVLLNEPQFVEASRTLARQALRSENDLEKKIAWLYRQLTGFKINEKQAQVLNALYVEELDRFVTEKDAAQLYANAEQNIDLDPGALASMTLVANTIMNFDDFYMKR